MKKLFVFIFIFTACQTTKDEQSQTAKALYEKAQKQSKRGYYLEAQETISKLTYQYPYSPFSVKAELLKADSAYEQADWEQAEKAYQVFIELYPHRKEREYAHWRQILSLNHQIPKTADRDLTLSKKILTVIHLFQRRFPKSSYKSQVDKIKTEVYNRQAEKEFKIASFYFKKKEYTASLGRLDVVIKNYALSSWYNSAVLLAQKIAKKLDSTALTKKYSNKLLKNN